MEIERLHDDTGFTMTQPFLIKRILEAAKIDLRMNNSRPTPVIGPLLSRDEDHPDRKHEWKYRTLTGMLGYLQGTSWPDISMATHQCTRFNSCPKLCHEQSVKRICKYLLDTNGKGIIFQPDPTKGLEWNVNADFAGGTVIKSNTSKSDNLWMKNFLHKSSDILVLLYVDDYIILSRDQKSIDMFVNIQKY